MHITSSPSTSGVRGGSATNGTTPTITTTTKSYDPFQDAESKPHLIQYDDGDVEWTNLYFRKFSKVPTKSRTLQVGTRIALWDEVTKQSHEGSILKIEKQRKCPHQVEFDKGQPEPHQRKTQKKTTWLNLNVESFTVISKPKKAAPSTTVPPSKDDIPSPSATERRRATPDRSAIRNHKVTTTATGSTTPQQHSKKKPSMPPNVVIKGPRLKSPPRSKAPVVPSTPKLVPKLKPACPAPQHQGGVASLSKKTKKPQQEAVNVAAAAAAADADHAAPAAAVSAVKQMVKAGQDLPAATTHTTTPGNRHSHRAVLGVEELRPKILRKRKSEFLQDLKESDIGQGWKHARVQAKKEEEEHHHEQQQPLVLRDKAPTILVDCNKTSYCSVCSKPCLETSLQATRCQHCFCHGCAQLYFANAGGNHKNNKHKKIIVMKDEYFYKCPKCKAPITPLVVVKSDETPTTASTTSTTTLWFPHLATSNHSPPSRKTLVRVLQQVDALRHGGSAR